MRADIRMVALAIVSVCIVPAHSDDIPATVLETAHALKE
jgi:hypothetical protein